jgi:septal ring factor EnvC (AmiA/AmiB activator)
MRNEKILFNAAMLYSLPNRGSYDPTLATRLFERLLKEFPGTSRRQVAVDQLSMLYELQRVRNEGLADRQSMQMRIAALERDTLALHHALDSVATALHSAEDQNTALRKNASRTERDLQDRESQLTALRAELKRLKEIDLHPPMRNAPHAHPRDTSGATARQQPR